MKGSDLRKAARGPLLLVALLALLAATRWAALPKETTKPVTYSELVRAAQDGKVEKLEVQTDSLRATLKAAPGAPAEVLVAERLPNVDDHETLDDLVKKGLVVSGHGEKTSWWGPMLWTFLPFSSCHSSSGCFRRWRCARTSR